MSGMGQATHLSKSQLRIADEFHHALLLEWFVVLGVLVVLFVGWHVLRASELRRQIRDGRTHVASEARVLEPTGRRVLRICFGLLWVGDGLLQSQSEIPSGLANRVVAPIARASGSALEHVVQVGIGAWNSHPVDAASSAVWIQVGLGLWLLAASSGRWSRLGGAASAVWALIVWIFGEAVGGMFAPGASLLFGAPGAALAYVVAGFALMVPDRSWSTARPGIWVLRGIGAVLVGMAVLQAWPGRGFWEGRTLRAMVDAMASTTQPHLVSDWLYAFARFDALHSEAVNAFTVAVMTVLGIGLLGARAISGRPRALVSGLALLPLLALAMVFLAADWVLVQDLGVFGGLGTDPNSGLPLASLLVAGYLAIARPADQRSIPPVRHGLGIPRTVPGLRSYVGHRPTESFRVFAATGAALVTVFGSVLMLAATL